ncbi:hypothetical protein AGMMS49573_10050 [Endomicrobiia bacterium]|nr:hypothetical protein AGMMS49573_10050 [Endomicrobiia bacterium]
MTVVKFKKIFAVILMLSVFLSGCQRKVITGISKNENDVSTSTNTPAPEPTPTPTPAPELDGELVLDFMPEPTSTPMPTSTPAPTPASPETTSQDKLKKLVLLCPPLTQLMFIYGLGLVEGAIQASLPYLFSFMPPALSSPIISTLEIIFANVPIVGAMWFALFSYRSEVSTLSNVLNWSLPALFVLAEFLHVYELYTCPGAFSHWLGVIDPDYFA